MTAFKGLTPVLRIFDVAKAREFYVDFLGFSVAFEHRYGKDFPLYLGLQRDACVLHLSEHHGDGSPGAHVRVLVEDAPALAKSLRHKRYRFAKPGEPSLTPWGTHEVTVTDPFGNRLTFVSPAPATELHEVPADKAATRPRASSKGTDRAHPKNRRSRPAGRGR